MMIVNKGEKGTYAAPGLSEKGLGAGEVAGELLLEVVVVLEILICAQMQQDALRATFA